MKRIKLKPLIIFGTLLPIFLTQSCTTYSPQYGKNISQPVEEKSDKSELFHRLFLIGDAGNAEEPESQKTLQFFEEKISQSEENATILFLGDNVYPKGIPDSSNLEKRKLAEEKLNYQLEIAKKFKGKSIFMPGNHDWYSGLEGLEEQERIVSETLADKHAFLPRKNCGIERLKINGEIILLVIDSQWYLENWNNYPKINDDCDIKTREDFFDEIKSELDKFQNETMILAIHHPLLSNGSHGGRLMSVNQQLYPIDNVPLPVVGSVFAFMRKTIGIPQDLHSAPYRELANRIKTEITDRDNVIVVSGHEHNLQYIEHQNIKQIISGAASKTDPARAVYPNDFSYGKQGYAILDLYKDGSATVSYFGNQEGVEKLLFSRQIQEPTAKTDWNTKFPDEFPKKITSSIYPPDKTQKSGIYNWLFGRKYRDYYGMQIEAPVVELDTLLGGLKPLRAGGGTQSNSLRLADKDGKEYAMRSLKKNTTRFLQTLYPEQYVEQDFENTGVSTFLYDFYTSSNPFYPFILNGLAQPLGINHTLPELYYVPKQAALGKYNEDYGDEFYMIEERPMSEHSKKTNFGEADDIVSTMDLLEAIQKNEKAKIDEEAFIRARLFDMLLGDWDRHQDQWRWAEHDLGENKLYRPIPRDRDQVFARYDGVLLKLMISIPATRHFQHFDEEPKSLKWLNKSGNPLDMAFIHQATEEDWVAQAKFIQENLTDEAIEAAFAQLPENLQDENSKEIIENLKIRRNKLQDWAKERYSQLQKLVVLTGTDKEDRFEINRLENGKTEIKIYRIKKEGEVFISQRIYSLDETKEIWVYGLDDDDIFEVNGESDQYIKIRLIGGQNHDVFKIQNGKKIIVYDYKTRNNTIENQGNARVRLTDNYNLNNYDYRKPQYDVLFALPGVGYNPDDGVKLGADLSYEVNQFNRDPFSQKHNFRGMYYFATQGFEFEYEGEFVNFLWDWNLNLQARWTSPNFSQNYFGFGNETENPEDEFGKDYNRVKIQNLSFAPSLIRKGRYGTEISFGMDVEQMKVDDTTDRFVLVSDELNPDVFESKYFGTVHLGYSYENYDDKAFPTLGFTFNARAEWTMNLDETYRNFTTLESHLGFTHKLIPSGKLVFSTLFKGKIILNDEFEFYQGANLGGNDGIRGFRNERFLGNKSFYQSSDLRLLLGSAKGFIPAKYGISGGFDYGRIWHDGEHSEKWHTSYGGGIWLNAAALTSLHLDFFHSEDGNRFSFGLGFNF
ncbi:metallophosphoesterase [Moheibacter sp.]|uniref:metallophosphoesterase n=1 Tax=Moheibacter sp. TaxID=1965316 RepID=UPI003C772596